MVEAESSGSLFIVFFLSLYTIILIPYTIYKLCNFSSESKQIVRPWLQVQGPPHLLLASVTHGVRPACPLTGCHSVCRMRGRRALGADCPAI